MRDYTNFERCNGEPCCVFAERICADNYKELLEVKGINHDIFRSDRKEEVTNLIIKFFKSNCNKKYSEIKKI